MSTLKQQRSARRAKPVTRPPKPSTKEMESTLHSEARRILQRLNRADLSFVTGYRHGKLVDLVERTRDELAAALRSVAARRRRVNAILDGYSHPKKTAVQP